MVGLGAGLGSGLSDRRRNSDEERAPIEIGDPHTQLQYSRDFVRFPASR
jgi:hypothetical protein